MAAFEDFTDADWRELLAEFRLLVTSVGFADWDAHTASAFDEDGESLRPRDALRSYALNFGLFLKVRSSENLSRMREELSGLLVDQNERPVSDAVVSTGERPFGPSVLSGRPSDKLIEEVLLFARAVSGEVPGYFDGDEGVR